MVITLFLETIKRWWRRTKGSYLIHLKSLNQQTLLSLEMKLLVLILCIIILGRHCVAYLNLLLLDDVMEWRRTLGEDILLSTTRLWFPLLFTSSVVVLYYSYVFYFFFLFFLYYYWCYLIIIIFSFSCVVVLCRSKKRK